MISSSIDPSSEEATTESSEATTLVIIAVILSTTSKRRVNELPSSLETLAKELRRLEVVQFVKILQLSINKHLARIIQRSQNSTSGIED